MGYYSEYLRSDIVTNFLKLEKERKKQLALISKIRGNDRDIMVFASDLRKNAPISINYEDRLPFYDQIPISQNKAIDIILETPGGSGEVVEDLVRTLRKKYDDIAVIIPGYAKSAGTIFSMSANDILMGETSALGPIDAQIILSNGKIYSADAFLNGLEKIKSTSNENKTLDLAYIPMLQNISPGEIEHCRNAQDFSKELVEEWLIKYKFKNWIIRNKNGEKVTEEHKKTTAKRIALDLCNNNKWKTHGKSLNIDDLEKLGLKISDYSKDKDLNEAIMRYYTLLLMTFDGAIYKVFETVETQIYKMLPIVNAPIQNDDIKNLNFDITCPKCNCGIEIVAPFGELLEENKNRVVFPDNNLLFCKNCHEKINLSRMRVDIEKQYNKQINIKK